MAEIKELWIMARELVGEEELTRRFRSWVTSLIRNARIKRENTDSDALYAQDCIRILADLNKRTKGRFQATDKAKHLIVSLLKKGYIPQDFFKVNEVKCAKWLGDAVAEDWLRPSTLYRPCHFDEYLSEWYAMDRQKQQLAEKRAEAQAMSGQSKTPADRYVQKDMQRMEEEAERKALVLELNDKAWNEFETWAEFMRWTMRFPDAISLDAYPMPERIRKMRKAPGMLLKVVQGMSPEWAEAEYLELKEKHSG